MKILKEIKRKCQSSCYSGAFSFQSTVYNGYHDALMMSFSINHIAVLNIDGFDYGCIIFEVRQSETIFFFEKS